MARNTFQGRMRTFAGRALSQIDARTGLPAPLLAQNLAGPIQIVLPEDPADAVYELGFLPAYWAIERVRVITPAGAGTITLSLPAYAGMAGVTLVAATADATDVANDMTLVPDMFTSYAKDRPITVETDSVTDVLRLGIWGFPLDDAAAQGG